MKWLWTDKTDDLGNSLLYIWKWVTTICLILLTLGTTAWIIKFYMHY